VADVTHPARRADIQGLRAVSVILVVAYHAGLPGFAGGYLGVDIFFVISGYVITLTLLRQHQSRGRISLVQFSLGRVRRLVPTTLVVVASTLAALWLLAPRASLGEARIQAVAAIFGVENLRFAAAGVNYLADESPAPFLHFWSLGIEEQFYLAWPLLLLLLLTVADGRRRALPVVVVSILCVLSFALAVTLTEEFAPWSFYLPVTRAWELGAGCLLALATRKTSKRESRRSLLGGWLGVVGILTAVALMGSSTPHPSWPTLVPVAAAVLILFGASNRRGSAGRILSSPVLTAVGDRSYSLYLWHWPALVVPVIALGRPASPTEVVLSLLVAVALSECTFRWVERRKQTVTSRSRQRGMMPSTARTLLGTGAAAAATLLIAGTVGATPVTATASSPVPWSEVTPDLSEISGSIPRVYADGCHLEKRETTAGACRYGPADANFEVVLLGDSHAAQWFSPLEEVVTERGGALTSLTKSACPVVDLDIRDTTLQRPYDECVTWRDDVVRRSIALAPDLIVLSAAGPGYRDEVRTDGTFDRVWADSYARTIEQLREALPNSAVVVLGETPRWPVAPVLCATAPLSAAQDCSAPVSELSDEHLASAEEEAVEQAGGSYVATVPWLCDDRCTPVVEGTFAYRDTSHVTDAMARRLASTIAKAVLPSKRSG
jgi:peptidoglycan/LPS O-acetylase OafA/YrhL